MKALLLFVAFAWLAAASKGVWPVVPENTPPPGTAKWTFPTQMVPGGGVTIGGGLVFFNVNQTVFALDAATGVMAWNWETSQGLASATPTYYNGFAYFNFGSMMYQFNPNTGELLNQVPISAAIGAAVPSGNLLLVGRLYSSPVAFLQSNLSWAFGFNTFGAGVGTQAQILVSEGRLYVLEAAGVAAYSIDTKSLIWTYPLSGTTSVQAAGMAKYREVLFIPNGRELLAINTSISGGPQSFVWWFLTETQMIGAPEVNHRDGLVYFTESGLSRSCGAFCQLWVWALNATTGAMVWKFTTNDRHAAVRSTPLYHNGVVYVGSSGTTLYALDALTGIQQWYFEADSAIVAKPAVFQEKTLVFVSLAGTVYSVDL